MYHTCLSTVENLIDLSVFLGNIHTPCMEGFSTLPPPPPPLPNIHLMFTPILWQGVGVGEEILLGIAKCMLSVLVFEPSDQTLQFDRRG